MAFARAPDRTPYAQAPKGHYYWSRKVSHVVAYTLVASSLSLPHCRFHLSLLRCRCYPGVLYLNSWPRSQHRFWLQFHWFIVCAPPAPAISTLSLPRCRYPDWDLPGFQPTLQACLTWNFLGFCLVSSCWGVAYSSWISLQYYSQYLKGWFKLQLFSCLPLHQY